MSFSDIPMKRRKAATISSNTLLILPSSRGTMVTASLPWHSCMTNLPKPETSDVKVGMPIETLSSGV